MNKKEIVRQIKYDAQQIESLINSINKYESELDNYKGKPAYDTRLVAIKLWEIDLEVHEKSLHSYYDKFNFLSTVDS